MTSSFRIGQRALLGVALLAIASGQVQGCASDPGSGSPGHASGGSPATGGSRASGGAAGGSQDAGGDRGRADANPPDDAQETGFITWTYKEKAVALYLPEPTGKPLPVAMYLHGCHNDNVYAGYWIIDALNAIEPCAVLLPTAPPAMDFACADWGGTYGQDLRPNMIDALAVLDQVVEQYGFDTKRQYLYGESMGGEGVYRLLVDFPWV